MSITKTQCLPDPEREVMFPPSPSLGTSTLHRSIDTSSDCRRADPTGHVNMALTEWPLPFPDITCSPGVILHGEHDLNLSHPERLCESLRLLLGIFICRREPAVLSHYAFCTQLPGNLHLVVQRQRCRGDELCLRLNQRLLPALRHGHRPMLSSVKNSGLEQVGQLFRGG